MELMSYHQCLAELDPTGKAGVTLRWLRAHLPYVKVGKKRLVPRAEFTTFCQRLLDECRANQHPRVSPSDPTPESGSFDTTTESADESVKQARAISFKLKKRSSSGRPSRPVDASESNLVIMPPR